jgi:MFS family permease
VSERPGIADLEAEQPAWALDDETDRDELRNRYYGLLQELRVVFPGVQVLAAFLLTVPFAQRFSRLDDVGESLFAVSLVSASLSVIAFLTPVTMHRFGRRTERAVRLETSVIATRVGFVLFLLALASSLAVVGRFLFDDPIALVLVAAVGGTAVVMWIVLPLAVRRRRRRAARAGPVGS